MKVCPAAVLNGKEPCAVQIGADQAVLSKTHAVAVVGLGHVARGRIRKVDAARVADEGEEVFSVSLRIGRGAASRCFRELGREGLKVRQFGRGLRAVFAERNVGVEAARRNFRDELGEPFAFGLQIRVAQNLWVLFDEGGGHFTRAEARMGHDSAQEGNGGLRAADHILLQGSVHDPERLLPVTGIGDEECAGGIVVGGEFIAGGEVRVEAHARSARRDVAGDEAGIGGEAFLRILQIHADLKGMEGGPRIFLGKAQGAPEGDSDHFFDQVDAVAAFGNAVLDLQTRVHLDHVGFARFGHEELHGGNRVIPHSQHQAAGIVFKLCAQFGRHAAPRRRRDFEELLVVALNRAVAFVKGKHIAPAVSDHLNFDVVNLGEIFFNEEPGVAKGGLRHGRSFFKGVFKFILVGHEENAASAAAALGLEHDRKTNFMNDLSRARNVDRFVGTRDHRNAEAAGYAACFDLIAEKVHGFGRSADEGDAGLGAELRKVIVFACKAPARMDGDAAAFAGEADDARKVKIGARVRSEQNELLCGGGCRLGFVDVGRGNGGNRFKSLANRAADAACGDAAVGDQNHLAAQTLAYFLKSSLLHGWNSFP